MPVTFSLYLGGLLYNHELRRTRLSPRSSGILKEQFKSGLVVVITILFRGRTLIVIVVVITILTLSRKVIIVVVVIIIIVISKRADWPFLFQRERGTPIVYRII